jgi:hypothetical protein
MVDGDAYCRFTDFVSFLAGGGPANPKDPTIPERIMAMIRTILSSFTRPRLDRSKRHQRGRHRPSFFS